MASRPDFNAGEGTAEGTAQERGQGADLREELDRLGQAAREAAYQQVENLRSRGMEKAHQFEDRIREEPLKSVLIAAGVGFLLGVMWMRD